LNPAVYILSHYPLIFDQVEWGITQLPNIVDLCYTFRIEPAFFIIIIASMLLQTREESVLPVVSLY
jgi:hypothetical protein